jgi:Ca-activated chloride channel family protein
LLLLLPAAAGLATEDQQLQREIKAKYLLKLSRMIDWPDGSNANEPTTPFVIGVLGDEKLKVVFEKVFQGRKIKSKIPVIRMLYELFELKDCDAVFISESYVWWLKEILSQTYDLPILTVTETDGACKQGAIFNLLPKGKEVLFELNNEAARRVNLRIPSRVLALATNIVGSAAAGPEPFTDDWNRGRQAFAQGSYAAAEHHFQEIVRADPANTDACFMLGLSQSKQGKSDEAIAYLRRAVEASPTALEPRLALAEALHKSNRSADTYEMLVEILEMRPEGKSWMKLLTLLVHTASDCTRLQQTADELRRQTEQSPQDALLNAALGIVLHAQKRDKEAFTALARAYELDWKESWGSAAIACAVRVIEQDAERAATVSRRAAFLGERLWASTREVSELVMEAELWIRAHEYKRALPWLNRAELADADNPRIAYDMGLALSRLGRLPLALGKLDQALELGPEPELRVAIYTLKGSILTAQGMTAKAAAAFDAAGEAGFTAQQSATASSSGARRRVVRSDCPPWHQAQTSLVAGNASLSIPGGTVTPSQLLQPRPPTFFKGYRTSSRFVATKDNNLSTFGLDVDTGSFSLALAYLRSGNLPPPASIQVEGWINFFEYDYESPAEDDFALYSEGTWSPFGRKTGSWLLRFGLKGREIPLAERPPAIVVLLVDTSGSMQLDNRLELVKRTVGTLLDNLRPDDQVGMVTYSSTATLVQRPTNDLSQVRDAVAMLSPSGGTNAESGLVLAYQLAAEERLEGALKRVILCSDGIADIDGTASDGMLQLVEKQAALGIELTGIGFGMGNNNDQLLEQLADRGNGHYTSVDSLVAAKRLYGHGLTGVLTTIAHDAEAQVEFNPKLISQYRFIGYENRGNPDERSREETSDGSEIGAGHTVTALYEVLVGKPISRESWIATLRLRYRPQVNGHIRELERQLTGADLKPALDKASPALQIAALVTELADILKDKEGSYSWKDRLYQLHKRGKWLVQKIEESPGEESPAEVSQIKSLVNLIDIAETLVSRAADDR